jgi:hypothetical protein
MILQLTNDCNSLSPAALTTSPLTRNKEGLSLATRKTAPRTFELLPAAFDEADSAYIIDNSDEAKAILIKEGNTIHRASEFPSIIKKSLSKIIAGFKGDIFMMRK